jgi:DNA-directed RNA polymerase specialized sigma24 family protein
MTTPVHISDDEIEGENKEAGRKKETMKQAVMATWTAWNQSSKNENSQMFADLCEICYRFILRKAMAVQKDLAKTEIAQTAEDFTQAAILRLLTGRHLHKTFDTPAAFYSFLNTVAFNTKQDAYRAVNANKKKFVKFLVTVENEAGETEDVENSLLHSEPGGFHGRRFHPQIPFKEMNENEKLVCAVCRDDQQERIIDGLVDRIITHDGYEYYDAAPLYHYDDIAKQLAEWTGDTWNERKVRNVVHRLKKKGAKRQAEQRAEARAYRAAWQAREQTRRDRLEAVVKALKASAQHIIGSQCAEKHHVEDACPLGRLDHREGAAA